MSKNNSQSKTQILIIGGASKIAREVFKSNLVYDVTGFSKFSKLKEIKSTSLLNIKIFL